jgi:hypothetical protein
LTDVSEVLAASIIRAIISIRLHGVTSQKTVIFFGLGLVLVACFYEQDEEPSVHFIREFLDLLNKYQLFIEDCTM